MTKRNERMVVALNTKVGTTLKVSEMGTRQVKAVEKVGDGSQVRLTLGKIGSEDRDQVLTVQGTKKLEATV